MIRKHLIHSHLVVLSIEVTEHLYLLKVDVSHAGEWYYTTADNSK